MNPSLNPDGRGCHWLPASALLLATLLMSGCQTCSYYGQAIKGHYQVVMQERKITRLLADPQTPAPLKARLQLVQRLRAFAASDLKLPADGHYEKYADLHRPFVVWNVEAAPEFSLEARTWWYPFAGSLTYRGYFSRLGAQNYAARLRRRGNDVFVGGVVAYSTLGWFKDPVLNTFLFDPEPDLAETVFHELGHQRVFASGDTDFNEAFATIVGQEGARRWLRARGDSPALAEYLAELRRSEQFARLVAATRSQLERLYEDERTPEGRIKATKRARALTPEQLRQEKQRLFDCLRQDYAQLKAQWGGSNEYDEWFAGALNNAQLNSIGTYYDLLPAFERLLVLHNNDLDRFYKAAQHLAREPKAERHRRLRLLAAPTADCGGRLQERGIGRRDFPARESASGRSFAAPAP